MEPRVPVIVFENEPKKVSPTRMHVSVMEVNHSNIIMPGQPEMPPMDPRIKWIAQCLLPTPKGPMAVNVVGDTKENCLKGMKQAIKQALEDFRYLSIEQVTLEV